MCHTLLTFMFASILFTQASRAVPNQAHYDHSNKILLGSKVDYPLGKALSMSFNASVYGWDYNVNPPLFRHLSTLDIKAARPSSIRAEVVYTANRKLLNSKNVTFINFTQGDIFISDGVSQFWLDKQINRYTRDKIVSDLTTKNLMNPLGGGTLYNSNILFAKNPFSKFMFKHTKTMLIRGSRTKIYIGRERWANNKGVSRIELYISEHTKLPMQISEYTKDENGKWFEQNREEYSNWKINPEITVSVFDTTPPPGVGILPNK